MQMVGAYPFERPEDKNDPAKLQKMIQVCAANMMTRLHLIVAATSIWYHAC